MDLIAGLYRYVQNTETFPTVLEICKQGWGTSVLHELACFGAVLVLPNPNPSDHPGPDRRVVVPTRNGMRLQGRDFAHAVLGDTRVVWDVLRQELFERSAGQWLPFDALARTGLSCGHAALCLTLVLANEWTGGVHELCPHRGCPREVRLGLTLVEPEPIWDPSTWEILTKAQQQRTQTTAVTMPIVNTHVLGPPPFRISAPAAKTHPIGLPVPGVPTPSVTAPGPGFFVYGVPTSPRTAPLPRSPVPRVATPSVISPVPGSPVPSTSTPSPSAPEPDSAVANDLPLEPGRRGRGKGGRLSTEKLVALFKEQICREWEEGKYPTKKAARLALQALVNRENGRELAEDDPGYKTLKDIELRTRDWFPMETKGIRKPSIPN